MVSKLLLVLTVLGGSTSIRAAAYVLPIPYPEEGFRSEWDHGCSDWRPFLPESENVGIRFERSDERYWLWGHARVKPERGETLEKLLESTRSYLSDSSTFLNWVLPGLNEHPRKGSSYFVELDDLKVEKRGQAHVYMTGPFHFAIPGLTLGGFSTIEVKWEDNSLSRCKEIFAANPTQRIWRFRMFPRPDVLQWMMGEMSVFPSENGHDAIIKIRLALKPSTLVYRLLPSKLIENELRFRAQRVLANFVDFRRSQVWKNAAISPAGSLGAPAVAIPKSGPVLKKVPSAKAAAGKSR
ncbi:MAG: hypothetical protein ABIR96_01315 [Bdellovibrionota bacterium]